MHHAHGLIVDNFAGGGGASTGIELALGRPVDIAINHDPAAIAMHKANHPHTRHYCESVWDIDPVAVCAGRPVDLAWFSPDCKHFSKAKGAKPVDKSIRGLAWVAVRWAASVRPSVIILENVEEFKTWGPVRDGRPVPEKRGHTFQSFIRALQRYGYTVDWRELRACDYGAPTIRKRFFLVARCDGQPVVWPLPTHGKGLLPYRTAGDVIDFSLPCPSIFATSEEIYRQYGVRAVRPLAEATLRRIARGIQKFVIDSPEPFVVKFQQNSIGQDVDQPLDTVMPGASRFGVVAPFLAQYHSYDDTARGQRLTDPLLTQDASNRYALVSAFLSKYFDGGYTGAGSALREPVGTVTGIDHNALVMSHLTILRNHCYGQDVREPLQTLTAQSSHFAEVRSFLVKYFGQGLGQSCGEPVHTVTTKDRLGLVTIQGEDWAITDIGLRMLTPRELFRAQGFPDDYVIEHDADGNPYPKSAQVARCGNSVSPPCAEALVRANLPALAHPGTIGSMEELADVLAI